MAEGRIPSNGGPPPGLPPAGALEALQQAPDIPQRGSGDFADQVFRRMAGSVFQLGESGDRGIDLADRFGNLIGAVRRGRAGGRLEQRVGDGQRRWHLVLVAIRLGSGSDFGRGWKRRAHGPVGARLQWRQRLKHIPEPAQRGRGLITRLRWMGRQGMASFPFRCRPAALECRWPPLHPQNPAAQLAPKCTLGMRRGRWRRLGFGSGVGSAAERAGAGSGGTRRGVSGRRYGGFAGRR